MVPRAPAAATIVDSAALAATMLAADEFDFWPASARAKSSVLAETRSILEEATDSLRIMNRAIATGWPVASPSMAPSATRARSLRAVRSAGTT